MTANCQCLSPVGSHFFVSEAFEWPANLSVVAHLLVQWTRSFIILLVMHEKKLPGKLVRVRDR